MNIIAPEIRLREQFIETGAYFYTRRSADSRVNICEAGIENETWQQCMIAIWENYAAVYPRSFFMRYVITFNRQNIRWVGRVQNVTNGNNFDQIALDIHMNDRWYTLTFRLLDSDMRRFEEEILRLRPSTINSERSRRRPNIRSGPFVVHPVGGPLVDIVDTALIYVTPLWLVILANGVVLREFPLDAIKKYNVLESLNQLRLDTGEETWAFEISDNQSTVLKELIRVLSKSSP